MNWLIPTKKSLTTFIIMGAIYLSITFIINGICTLAHLVCNEKPKHSVPNLFPGSSSCQVCATSSELITGYIILILLYVLIPLIIIYIISGLLNIKKK